MGAALVAMVARLTLGKLNYADVQPAIEALVQRAEMLRARFQQLMQEDIDAYGKLSASFKMPRETAEQKAERTKAIQEGLVAAALVPLEMAERAAELVQCCQRIAEIGNVNVLSDVAVATMQASSAGTGASWMVRANVRSLKDLEMANALSERLSVALDVIAAGSQQVISKVGERA
jgi:formiminotetrahydrofolate cyclodeaminase